MDRDMKFMDYATCLAKSANCIKGKVGAVIVKGGKIVACGVNSVPSGIKPCTDETCIRKKLGLKSGENQELCFVVHAEQNAIIDALNKGIDIKGGILYVTKHPCIICAKMLINVGISEIVFLEDYPDKYSKSLLAEAGIILRKY